MSSEIQKEVNKDLSDLRVPYFNEDVTQKDFSIKNPLKLFDIWFNLAHNTEGIKEANAMALATADKSGKPSVRYVLLKGYGKDGFRFFTNFNSRKGNDMAENPQVALLFYWEPLCRQIRIEGTVVKLSDAESEQYFHSRPRSSQISAIVSQQSEVIEDKEMVIKKQEELESQYADDSKIIPKPDYWGGFKVIPESFEFWCGRTNRLHDRIKFRKASSNEKINEKTTFNGEDGWLYEYLFP